LQKKRSDSSQKVWFLSGFGNSFAETDENLFSFSAGFSGRERREQENPVKLKKMESKIPSFLLRL